MKRRTSPCLAARLRGRSRHAPHAPGLRVTSERSRCSSLSEAGFLTTAVARIRNRTLASTSAVDLRRTTRSLRIDRGPFQKGEKPCSVPSGGAHLALRFGLLKRTGLAARKAASATKQ
jgi:hypothetical protein